MIDIDGMTPAQSEALKKAWDLIGEHFDCALLVLEWETSSDTPTDAHCSYWHGGALHALGLAEYARHRILAEEPSPRL